MSRFQHICIFFCEAGFLLFRLSKVKIQNKWMEPTIPLSFARLPATAVVKLWTNPSTFTSQGCVKFWREFLERFTEHAHILTWKRREVTEALRGKSTHNNPLEKSSRRVSIVKNPPPALPRSLLSISTSFLIYRLDFSCICLLFQKNKKC